MSFFGAFTDMKVLDANRTAKRPGGVWCFAADGREHAVDYRCDGDFYVTFAPTTMLCARVFPVGGHAHPGRPTCPDCLTELVRAAPILAQRLTWNGRVSTCGRWRVRKQRRPAFAGHPWVVLELHGRTWGMADSKWCPDDASARELAQDFETQRVIDALKKERRG